MELEPRPLWRHYGLALAYHALDRPAEAEMNLRVVIDGHQHYAAYQIAQVYAFREEVDTAFEWLERAYDQRDPALATLLKSDVLLTNLHGDPRWTALLEKMGLAG